MAGERSIVYLCQAGIHGDTGRGAPKESVTGRDLRAQQRHVGSGGQPRGALSRSGQLPGTEAGSRGGCRVTRIAQVMRMWTRADTKAGQGHEGPGLSPMGRRLGGPGVPAPRPWRELGSAVGLLFRFSGSNGAISSLKLCCRSVQAAPEILQHPLPPPSAGKHGSALTAILRTNGGTG